MRNSTPKIGQKFCQGETVSEALGSVALDYIQAKYQPLRSAQEFLARAAKVTPATALNWLRRRCVPQADNLGELIKNDPEFRACVIAWIERNAGENMDS